MSCNPYKIKQGQLYKKLLEQEIKFAEDEGYKPRQYLKLFTDGFNDTTGKIIDEAKTELLAAAKETASNDDAATADSAIHQALKKWFGAP
jgi:hypothetical protein